MPSGYNALAARPKNKLAYPGQDLVEAFTQGLGPMLYGAAKGTAATVVGLPGDIEQLARQLLLSGAAPDSYTAKNMAAQALLPTSDRVKAMLPSLSSFGAGPQAQYTENVAANLGQNVVGNLVAPKALPAVAQMAGQGAAATGRFVAPKAGQLAEQYMVRTGGILPLDVYHGSPHTFPPTARNPLGEFDASKIGTGEGNQSYGHGIYTAENPNIAKGYAEQLSTAQGPLGDVAKYWRKNGGESAFRAFAKNAGLPPAEIESTANVIRNTGNLYKVDLPDEKIAKMLDFDKHLSEQSKAVQDILLPYQKEIGGSFGTGEQTLKAIAFERRMKGLDDSPAAVAQQLKEMGIPGVQYLDAGSRVKPNITDQKLARLYDKYNGDAEAAVNEMMRGIYNTPKEKEAIRKVFLKQLQTPQTRNFVVFPGEEKSMTILERNSKTR